MGAPGTIAAIEPHPKRRMYYNVIIAGRQPLTVHEDVVVALGLAPGIAVTQDLLDAIEHQQGLAEAQATALRLLAAHWRSRSELAAALLRKGFTGPVAEAVLAKLENLGVLSDERFAREYVRSLLRRRQLGRQGLLYRLRQRGLQDEVAEGVVAEAVEGADETQRALIALEQRLPHWKMLPVRERRAKAWRYLARLGYDEDTISDALNAALPED